MSERSGVPNSKQSRSDGAALRAIARAIELQQKGRLDDAEAIYAKLLRDDPRDPTVLINAGVLAMARRDVATAVERLQRAVAVVPANGVAHANLGFALLHAGRHDEALATLDRAIALNPDAHAHNTRGIVLARLKRHADARAAFERALSMLPAYGEAALNLGELANRDGDAVVAREAYGRVLARDPGHALALAGVAFADAIDGRLDDAISTLQAVVREQPDVSPAWQTLGAVLNWAGRHADAEDAFRRALDIEPDNRDARFGLASSLLSRGRYDEGFAAFDASRAGYTPPGPALRALPVWSGEPLAGALVLHGEQGLGDVVQFARFLPALHPRVQRVVAVLEGYWSTLAPLIATLEGIDAVVTDADALRDASSAARCSILSLPGLARATSGALPQPPYLAATPERVAAWRDRVDRAAKLRVGLAWSVFARDDRPFIAKHKSVPPDALAPLLDVPDVAFHSLQPGPAGDPSVFGARAARVATTGGAIADFGDTAALIANLDVVVTPDTAVAHVAGALGKPVLLLERFHGCWRWRLDAERTPWYPSLTILRQPRPGDWQQPIARAAAVLRNWPLGAPAYQ